MIFQAAEVVKSAVFITILQAAHGYEGKFFFSGWRARKKRILLNLGKSVEAKKIFNGLQPDSGNEMRELSRKWHGLKHCSMAWQNCAGLAG